MKSSNDAITPGNRSGGSTKNKVALDQAMADIRNITAVAEHYKDVLRVTFDIIQQFIPFDNVGVFVLNEAQDAVYELSDDRVITDPIQATLATNNLFGPINFNGNHPRFWGYSDTPIRFSIADQASLFAKGTAIRLAMDMGLEQGLQQGLGGPLYYQGNKVGLLCFNSKHEQAYDEQHLRLFNLIGEQIAPLIANIQAREQAIASQKEKSTLLAIAEKVAAVTTAEDLLQVIMQHIEPLFNFSECGLVLLCNDGKSYADRTFGMKEMLSKDSSARILGPAKRHVYAGSPAEWMINQMKDAQGPILFDSHSTIGTDTELTEDDQAAIHQWGLSDCLACNLHYRGELLGYFCIRSKQSNFFRPAQFRLFQAITHIVSIAVGNIEAYERLVKNEQEKSILLSISEDIATVRDMKDLLRIIIDKIKPLFNFYDCGIVIIDDDHQYWDLAVLDPDIVGTATTNIVHGRGFYKEHKGIPYKGSVLKEFVERIERAGCPQSINFQDDFHGYTDSDLLRLYKSLGYREGIGTVIKTGGKTFGCFVLDFLEEGIFNTELTTLFKNIVDQIAVAVSNILANRKILQREQEKTKLLSITEYIASARNTADLVSVLNDKARDLILFQDTTILILENSNQSYFDLTHPSPQHWSYPGSYPASVCKRIEAASGPVIEFLVPENIYFPESLVTTMKSGGSIIGLFFLHSSYPGMFHSGQFEIFQALADQVSAAVSNILANEKITHLLKEMQSSKQEVEKLNRQLEAQKTYLLEEAEEHYNYGEIVGRSKALKNCLSDLGLVAHTDTTVLVLGETGTGKELVARALHSASPRKDKLLVKLNCAALPAQLLESELFGHEKGAFTGAVDRRIGKFELAQGGTLFLDEIGELPLDLQAKLLRAIQEKEIERLGSNKTIKLDVRIVAATNRNLEREVLEGRFRADLYYRLSVFPVYLPPLRDRAEDIPLLATHFLNKFSKKIGKSIDGFSKGSMASMMVYPWPGNVRELEHLVERQVILSSTGIIKDVQLPKIHNTPSAQGQGLQLGNDLTLEQYEREYILHVIRKCKGKISGPGGAATILDIPYTTLQSRMKKLGIKKEHVVIN
jgi:formate hydrogenlyase transcriptional activator